MSVNWLWKDKCGEIVVEQKRPNGEPPREFTLSLYEGNAWLIMLYEYKENGHDMYNMYSFFVDKTHAKKCLGLQKNGDGELVNIFDDRDVFKIIRIDKTKCRNWKEIITTFIQAFDTLEIEIYKEKKV